MGCVVIVVDVVPVAAVCIIIIIIIISISFMQGIYTYIPETNHVPREHFVTAILVLLFMVRISLVPCVDSIVSLRLHFPKYVWRA